MAVGENEGDQCGKDLKKSWELVSSCLSHTTFVLLSFSNRHLVVT